MMNRLVVRLAVSNLAAEAKRDGRHAGTEQTTRRNKTAAVGAIVLTLALSAARSAQAQVAPGGKSFGASEHKALIEITAPSATEIGRTTH